LVRRCRSATGRPLVVKLSPALPDIPAMAQVVADAGGDAVSLVNTMPGMLDGRLGNPFGGVSGPALLPIGLLATQRVRERVGLPVIGVGGIRSAADARAYLAAGASLVAIGTAALALADRLPGLAWAKLGPVLYVQEGPALVREFAARGVRVFLDLKWHDIPTVVAGAVAAARDLGVAMATVHCLGGPEMLAAARDAAGEVAVVGVTVLT